MTDSEWMVGFSIATRIYYSNGNLDIPDDAVTKGGYKIGEWIKYTREHVNQISSFDINNLASYGFIWGTSRGIHNQFHVMYNKLSKLERTEKGIIKLSAMKEDPDLMRWVAMIIEGRKACDNAVITLREIEMLTSIGFPWGDKWPTRQAEESAWVSKNSYAAQAIRDEAMRLASSPKRFMEVPKPEPVVETQTKIVEVDNSTWQERLLRVYLGLAKDEITGKDKLAYLALLRKNSKSESEKNFLRMLNNGVDGEAAWVLGIDNSAEIKPTVKDAIPLLNKWAESEIEAGTDIRTCDLSPYRVENGWQVTALMGLLYNTKSPRDKKLIKDTLNDVLYLRYLDVIEANKQAKKKETAKKVKKAEPTKEKQVEKKAESDSWTVKKPRDWFKMFTYELESEAKNSDIVPNNIDEAALAHNDRLVKLIREAYENKSKLMGKLYINNLRECSFFFIEKSTEDIDKLRKYYKLLMEKFGIRAYSKVESEHSKQIVNLLKEIRTTAVDDGVLDQIGDLLEMDFADYQGFMKVYKHIMKNGNADEIKIAQEIKRSIPLAMKSKKIRA